MGVIEGGWEFVWAAYGISAAWFALYGTSLVLRLRAEQRRQEREAGRRVAQ
jgi:cell division protein FtsW (lipid II flippase)